MLPPAQIADALSTIKLVSAHGPWSRAVGYRFLLNPPTGMAGAPQPLWGGSARIAGARFTPKAASTPSILLTIRSRPSSKSALLLLPGGPVPIRSAPWVVVSVDGVVSNILDLTDASTLLALGTTEQEMAGAWVRAARPPTQALAQAAYGSGRIAGIKYGSAKRPGGLNLVVFPGRISVSPANYLEVYDPHGNLAQRIEP